MKRTCTAFALLAAVCAGATVHAAERVLGSATRLADGAPAYSETHVIDADTHRIVYRAPDGALIAENTLDYRCSDSAPAFVQRDLRTGSRLEGGWVAGRYRVLATREPDSTLRDAPRESGVASAPHNAQVPEGAGLPLVASSGFDRFLRAAWDRLLGGEAVAFRFALPGRFSGIALRARHDPAPADGLTWFVIEPRQPVLRALADPIRVAYDDSRRLAVYRGVSNLADASGKALEVEIRYRHDTDSRQEVAGTEPHPVDPRISPASQCGPEQS